MLLIISSCFFKKIVVPLQHLYLCALSLLGPSNLWISVTVALCDVKVSIGSTIENSVMWAIGALFGGACAGLTLVIFGLNEVGLGGYVVPCRNAKSEIL